jgi:uncharacterized membrane protein
MLLAPLLDAAPVIQMHAFSALTAFVLGVVQIAAPKGTMPHRALGWVWAALIAVVAITSFWIHTIRQFGNFSLIHLLSIFTIVMLPLGLLAAHHHQVGRHRRMMLGLFLGALVIAGVFTLYPGRIMHAVMFGG